jgi:hypothetical protein
MSSPVEKECFVMSAEGAIIHDSFKLLLGRRTNILYSTEQRYIYFDDRHQEGRLQLGTTVHNIFFEVETIRGPAKLDRDDE